MAWVRKERLDSMWLALVLLLPFAGTTLGSACVFFQKAQTSPFVERLLKGFAAGVMVAASVWSLLIPAMDESQDMGQLAWVPAAVGFTLGILFLLLLDHIIPHLHSTGETEGLKVDLPNSVMLALAVILHNIPEGMSIATPLLAGGGRPAGAIGIAALSGLPTILGALAGYGAGEMNPLLLAVSLSFAAGAMLYVVFGELLPEAAGLWKSKLPALAAEVPESGAALAPIVSGGRAAALIAKVWDKRYRRVPDFVVLEGPLAGGHLGFSPDEAKEAQAGRPVPLRALLRDGREALAPFREKYGRDIPVFVAGGVKSGAELRRYMDQGAAGGQFATRFIATEECDASPAYKQALLDAKAEDITIVQSPVGMPGRALKSPLIQRVEAGTQPKITRCGRCLSACNCRTAPYCSSTALIAAVAGDWENGLFFCGGNAGEVNRLSTVREQMDQIMNEWRAAQ